MVQLYAVSVFVYNTLCLIVCRRCVFDIATYRCAQYQICRQLDVDSVSTSRRQLPQEVDTWITCKRQDKYVRACDFTVRVFVQAWTAR